MLYLFYNVLIDGQRFSACPCKSHCKTTQGLFRHITWWPAVQSSRCYEGAHRQTTCMTHSLSPLKLIRWNTAQTSVLFTSTRHGKGGASGWLSIPLDCLWDIPAWFCTVFRFFLLLHDQRPAFLIRTSKGSLHHCPVSVLNDNYRSMIITVQLPFGVPFGAGTNGQLHPQASKKGGDCWTAERRDREEKMEDSHWQGSESIMRTSREWHHFVACMLSVPVESWITNMWNTCKCESTLLC